MVEVGSCVIGSMENTDALIHLYDDDAFRTGREVDGARNRRHKHSHDLRG